MVELDLENMTDDELYALVEDAQTELGRRQTAEVFEQQVEELYTNARQDGAIPEPAQGEQWVQPTHAGNAYKKGDVVTYDGKKYVSTVTPNVWAPTVSGWHHVAETDPETGEPGIPDYVPPTGGHDVYNKGAQVRFNGAVYESVIDNNSWSPTEYPAGWQLIEEETGEEDEPVEDEGDQLPAWQPDGHAYTVGDQFDHEGTPYRVLQDHTSQPHWLPNSVPALYERGQYTEG